jgi:murein DD-endopeptidase MepM/ murein hydrolase activator NlpD
MLENLLRKYQSTFHPVVPFDADNDRLLLLDFTSQNKTLTEEIFNDIKKFSAYINDQLKQVNAKYGIGGYNEHRTIYSRSATFDSSEGEEPRRLHLGIDIWGDAGTPVFAPMGGMVHSFAFNNSFGDYGATVVLLHQLDGIAFYTLYGHVSVKDIGVLNEGQYVNHGQEFAHFGEPHENGQWPPHLHFQIIADMQFKKGDYAGVCKFSEREKYLHSCPDPDLILQMMQYAVCE